ncbi:MAG: hypothetical protein HRU18_28400 [Pseudoalteromonas sp.]|nr:hypothetical protein [Pseudoalteromonas sp.]
MNDAYDRRGNLTSLAQDGVSQTYHYDAQDPLMRVSGRRHRSRSRILRDFALDASPIRA